MTMGNKSEKQPTNNQPRPTHKQTMSLMSGQLTTYGGSDITREKIVRKAYYEKKIAMRDAEKLRYANKIRGKKFTNPNQKELVKKFSPHSGTSQQPVSWEVCRQISDYLLELQRIDHLTAFRDRYKYKTWQTYCLMTYVMMLNILFDVCVLAGLLPPCHVLININKWLVCFAIGFYYNGYRIELFDMTGENPPRFPVPIFARPPVVPSVERLVPQSLCDEPLRRDNTHQFELMEPQSGLIPVSFASDLRKADLSGLITNEVMLFIERTLAMFVGLKSSTNPTNGAAVVMLYVSSIVDVSLYSKIENIVSGLLYEESTPQNGTVDTVLSLMTKASESWRVLRGHPLAEKVCLLCTALISAGICSASSFEWSYGNIQLFSRKISPRFLSAGDVFEAVLEVAQAIIATGARCITERSFTPFFPFLGDSGIDDRYLKITQAASYADIGRLEELSEFTESTFLLECSDLTKAIREAKDASSNSIYKEMLERKVLAVGKMEATFKSKIQADNFRKQPFAILVAGDSGIGKSTICNTLMQVCLHACGHKYSPSLVCTLDGNEKFHSTYRSDQPGMIVDDLCNTSVKFTQENPLRPMIDLVNNVVMTARKAEAHEKGKTPVRIDVLCCTTNVHDVMAGIYSNEPISILRRWDIHIVPTVKKEFRKLTDEGEETPMLDSARVVDLIGTLDSAGNVIQVPDVWTFDVYQWVLLRNEHKRVLLQDEDGNELRNIDVFRLVDYVRKKCVAQRKVQERLMDNYRDSSLNFCSCGLPTQVCSALGNKCSEELDPHLGLVPYLASVAVATVPAICPDRLRATLDAHEHWRPNLLVLALARVMDRQATPSWLQGLCLGALRPRECLQRLYIDVCLYICIVFLMLIHRSFFLLFPLVLYAQARVYTARRQRLLELAELDPNHLHWAMDFARQRLPLAIGIAGGGLFLLKMINFVRTVKMLPQGNLNPSDQKEHDARMQEENPWVDTFVSPLPGTLKQRAQTHQEAVSRVERHVCQILYDPSEGPLDVFEADRQFRYCVTGLAVCSGMLVTPNHMWFPGADPTKVPYDELFCLITVHDKIKNGGSYRVRLSFANSVKIGIHDLRLVKCTKLGACQDIVWMFPEELDRSPTQATFITRNRSGIIDYGNASLKPQPVMYKFHETPVAGFGIVTDFPTAPGQCISPYVTKDRKNVIGALHIAGVTGKNIAAGLCLTQADLHNAVATLTALNPNVVLATEGPILEPQYCKNIVTRAPQHDRCPTRYLPPDSRFTIYGVINNQSTFKSDVAVSPISDLVTTFTGWPNVHGPPKVVSASRAYRPYLLQATQDRIGPHFETLRLAVEDYIAPLEDIITHKSYIRDKIRPLNNIETICGIDGVRFIDAMNKGSSMGFPLNKPKRDFLIALDPEQHPANNAPFDFTPDVHIEIERMREQYSRGLTCNPVFSSKIKDEPTKVTKDKVRIFHVTQVAFSYLLRQYFLSMLSLLAAFPLVSECAVGINAEGPEWDQLIGHVTGFGEDRMIGIDYKNYDNSLNVDVIQTALSVFMRFAHLSGNYSPEDFVIMRGLISDLLFPCVAVNGTLLRICGTNTSGNNLTTAINSIANSLLFRCSYMSVSVLNKRVPFRDSVRLMTYGDDAIGSVSDKANFDMVAHQQFCLTCDITVTMSDKSSEMSRFVNFKDIDFLKRTSRFCPARNVVVSCLDPSSIFKMLHIIRSKSELSPEEQIAVNLATANRAFSFYAEETYVQYNTAFKKIAVSSGLVVPELNKTYGQYVREWLLKYVEYPDISSLSSQITTDSLSEAGGQYDDWDGDSPNECAEI